MGVTTGSGVSVASITCVAVGCGVTVGKSVGKDVLVGVTVGIRRGAVVALATAVGTDVGRDVGNGVLVTVGSNRMGEDVTVRVAVANNSGVKMDVATGVLVTVPTMLGPEVGLTVFVGVIVFVGVSDAIVCGVWVLTRVLTGVGLFLAAPLEPSGSKPCIGSVGRGVAVAEPDRPEGVGP